jgi:hypothetical protein
MNIEEKIIEQRTSEALKKNLMGQSGKIYLIAKFLGSSITKQSDDTNFLNYDPWEDDPDKIPILSDDVTSYDVGYAFDGLRRGLHLEIVCNDYDMSIKLHYEGYCYYHEEDNALLRYYPYETLEKIIDSLYEVVENKIQETYIKMRQEEVKLAPELEKAEIQRLRDKWGNII